MRAILQVKRKEQLTPHYLRIILTGENIEQYKDAETGDNNKIIIPKDKAIPIEIPDMATRGLHGYDTQYIRTYTLRSLDLEKKEMAIDFVIHEGGGPACDWARNATIGDDLGVLMRIRNKKLLKAARDYFFFGDHCALPVISALLERLDPAAKGRAYIEVHTPEDVLDLKKPQGIDIIWLFNEHPGPHSHLPEKFNEITAVLSADSYVFVAAEHTAANTLQERLRFHVSLTRENWQSYGYWKFGEAEGTH